MQSSRADRLKAKVAAVNRANEFANRLYPVLRAIFEPLVGQKILKADGSLLEKYKKLVPALPSTHNLHVYRHSSDYSLAWTVKTNEHDSPNTVLYHEVTFYVGDLRGQTLEKLTVHQFTAREDYTVEEVAGKRAAYEAAKQAADNARSELYPFGEYDN